MRVHAVFYRLLETYHDRICCVPVVHIEGPNGTTVGLGDAFVGEFSPALLSRMVEAIL